MKKFTDIFNEGQYSFSSLQFNLEKNLAQMIHMFQLQMDKDDIYVSDEIKGYEEIPHITIRYGLETCNLVDVLPIFNDIKSVKVTFGTTQIFESKDYDVLFVDVFSTELRELNRRVGLYVDLPGETYKEYQPHATIAYIKKGTAKKYIHNPFMKDVMVYFTKAIFSTKEDQIHIIDLN